MTDKIDIPDRLQRRRTLLVVVDVQERFHDLIHGMDRVLDRTQRLVRFCREMGIPIIVTEHYSRKLGATVADLRRDLGAFEPVEKIHFSCCGCGEFNTRLESLERDQVILCGIETHVCIYQTAVDLRRKGRQVIVPVDAVGSCTAADREIGLQAIGEAGVQRMGAQMLMFEILNRAGTEEFKAVAQQLKY